jgi:ABC-type oligopeptide transport system substrate-binding subunit
MHNRKVSLLTTFAALVLVACGDTSSLPSSSTPSSSSSTPTSSASTSTSEAPAISPANGLLSYTAASYEEKAKIIGALEKYAQDNYMTGIPLYDSGGLVMYANRLSIPSNVFIPNFGFGVGEGTILSPMTADQEPEAAYRRYYHTWTNVNTGTINYMNSQTATVADFYNLFSGAYYTTRLNSAKDNYEWVNELATARPIALNADANGLATKWKVPVRVGGNLVYSTLSTDSAITPFNGRAVAKEDYLTPFKLMLNNRWFRATDLGSATGGFVGVAAYLAAIAAGQTPDFSTVGIKLSETENAIEFEFNQKQTSFFALYNLSSSLFSPIPETFITAIGGAAEYGKPSRAVDTVLSVGVYTVEKWEDQKQFVFKKNPAYINAGAYNFEGIKYAFVADANTAFNEFLSGKLDAVGIPTAQVANYKTDPRTRKTLGAAVFKLNVNATTADRWEELFGVNGSIAQTPINGYWDVKPLMSNKNFLDGLYFAINRTELATATARNPAQAFLSDAYMADPENAVSYRKSAPGLAAYADRSPSTLGFNRELAKTLFKAAGDELVTAGKYIRGTSVAPTTITLKVHHQVETRMNDERPYYASYIEDTFNEANTGLRLVLDHYFTAGDPFAPYDAMAVGQFDIAMGTISGSTLNPLSFMEILTSDNRTGFTLSWTGVDTAKLAPELVYDNKQWSFNALFEAAMGAAVVSNGESATLFNIGAITVSDVQANTFDVTATGVIFTALPDQVQVNVVDAGIFIVTGATTYEFIEANLNVDFVVNTANGTWTLTLNDVPRSGGSAFYVDLYVQIVIDGVAGPVQNIYKQFSVPAAA